MGEKICINTNELIKSLNSCYNGICDKIDSTERISDIEPEINKFYDTIDNAIVSFFYMDNAGDGIKKLIERCDENTMVKAMNFMFAFNQYKEYLDGMKHYIDEAKQKNLGDAEVVRSIEDIITKDDDFIKSIFVFGENKNNTECSMNIGEALKCLDTLFSLRNAVSEFKHMEYSGNILDRLATFSRIKMLYFAVTNIFNQVERICKDVNGENTEVPVEKPVYAVF